MAGVKASNDRIRCSSVTLDEFLHLVTIRMYNIQNNRDGLTILSNPGIGKTRGIENLCREMGWGFRCLNMQGKDIHSIQGIPKADEGTGLIDYLYNTDLPLTADNLLAMGKGDYALEIMSRGGDFRDVEKYGGTNNLDPDEGILLIDEVTAAEPEVLGAIRTLFTDHKFNGYIMPASWLVVCAGNGQGQGGALSGSGELPEMFKTAAMMYNLVPDVESWLDYAAKKHLDPHIINFIQYRISVTQGGAKAVAQELMSNYSKYTEAGACPRTWEIFARFMEGLPLRATSTEDDYIDVMSDFDLWNNIGCAIPIIIKKDIEIMERDSKGNIVKDANGNPKKKTVESMVAIARVGNGETREYAEMSDNEQERNSYKQGKAIYDKTYGSNSDFSVREIYKQKYKARADILSKIMETTDTIYSKNDRRNNIPNRIVHDAAISALGTDVGERFYGFYSTVSEAPALDFEGIVAGKNPDISFKNDKCDETMTMYCIATQLGVAFGNYFTEKYNQLQVEVGKSGGANLKVEVAEELYNLFAWLRAIHLKYKNADMLNAMLSSIRAAQVGSGELLKTLFNMTQFMAQTKIKEKSQKQEERLSTWLLKYSYILMTN